MRREWGGGSVVFGINLIQNARRKKKKEEKERIRRLVIIQISEIIVRILRIYQMGVQKMTWIDRYLEYYAITQKTTRKWDLAPA